MRCVFSGIVVVLICCSTSVLCKHNDTDTEECAWSPDCRCLRKVEVVCTHVNSFPKFSAQKGLTLKEVTIKNATSLTIDQHAFDSDTVNKIESLSLTNVGLRSLGGKGSFLAPLHSLTRLDLSRNNLDYTKMGGLLDVKDTLKTFVCHECGLKGIPEEVGSLTNLKSIDLRSNDISNIPKGVFQKLTKLHSLILSNNPIGSGKLDGLSDLKKVTTFHTFECDNCHLTEIPTDISTHPYLKALQLQHNNITVIRKKDFDGTSTKLPEDQGLELLLRFNQIANIEKDALVSLKYDYINLGFNLLKEFDMSWIPNKVVNTTSRNGVSLKGCELLEKVYVSDIKKIPTECSVIDLSESGIGKFDQGVFAYCMSNKSTHEDYILLKNVEHFDCNQDLKWMVPCSVCRSQKAKDLCHYNVIQIEGSKCSNKTKLSDHLKDTYVSTYKDCEKKMTYII